ncbi:MAG: LPS export ABC transporter ATP-binding protein [Elusimicrobia bacterium]|jgi:lipopolysaccharide export system ATP-binding protein|nr:LPS export ABC transporter ATP-binding protein [Elusimicrobiota bacterium]
MSLRCENLVKSYKSKRVVDEVSLKVERNEIVGLLGPNGAGKTTTFNMIAGLIKSDAGKVYMESEEITSVAMYKRALMGVGYLTQEPSIFRDMTVEDNILAVLQTVYKDKDKIIRKCNDLLIKFGIDDIRKQKAIFLSGGEKRRLEIARSLIREPKIMLLDEPFVGIDPIAVSEIQKLVAELKSEGYGILITDHNVRETLQIIDRAYIMYEGRILLTGNRDELLESPEARKFYLGNKFKM